jgi:hypothetical protein
MDEPTAQSEALVSAGDPRDERGRFVPGNKFAAGRGQVRNPSGRNGTLSRDLRLSIKEIPEGDTRTNSRIIADRVVELAKGGDMRAAEFIADRLEGRPRQALDINTDSTDQMSEGELLQTMLEELQQTGMTPEAARAQLIAYGIDAGELDEAIQ